MHWARHELLALNPLWITNNQRTIVINFHQDFENSMHADFYKVEEKEPNLILPGKLVYPIKEKKKSAVMIMLPLLNYLALNFSHCSNCCFNSLEYQIFFNIYNCPNCLDQSYRDCNTREALLRGRIITVDFLLGQLLFKLKLYFSFFTKQPMLMRRPTVLILPLQ